MHMHDCTFIINITNKKILYLFLPLLLFGSLQAAPPQRLIVYFAQALNAAQENELKNYLDRLQPYAYRLAEHSDRLRWIVVLQAQLEQQALLELSRSLQNHPLVSHVEADTIMKIK